MVKRALKMQTLYEDLGWDYIGVADGNKIEFLEDVLNEAKLSLKPCIVHIHTTKGKGYSKAEKNPGAYHGVGSFELEEGVHQGKKSFSSVFGEEICALSEKNEKICAITALFSEVISAAHAMCSLGTIRM